MVIINVNLTKRRIASFTNYLRQYEDGKIVPYLEGTASNGGTLSILKIPYGEYLASREVSANINDQRNSVYSVKAGLERKIEVLSATKPNPDAQVPRLTFTEEIKDFAFALQGQKLKHRFAFTNTGTVDLQLDKVEPACGCTVANFTKTAVPPGGKGYVELVFDTKGKHGNQIKTATITSNASGPPKVLTITSQVITEDEIDW